MNPSPLEALADAAGVSPAWTDFRGERHEVDPDVLRAILAAIGLGAGTQSDIEDSLRRLANGDHAGAPALTIANAGARATIRCGAGIGRIVFEDGDALDIELTADDQDQGAAWFLAPDRPGYHTIETGDRSFDLALAPKQGWTIEDAAPGRRLWGLAAQVYSLRGGSTAGFGDFAALAELCEDAARVGADAIAVSPTHALFTADAGRYSPYAPSSRLFLNPLHAVTGASGAPDDRDDALIDWPRAAIRKLDMLRADYAAFRESPAAQAAFRAFVAAGGDGLLSHARFEALDGRFRGQGVRCWWDWPDGFADAASRQTRGLTADHPEVAFHLFLQFAAASSLAEGQRRARDAGMAIGLISDIAVGMDPAGSHAWSHPAEVLTGLTIGAPPDLLGPLGQSWGLTSFSPHGLAATGFAGYLATLRAAMRHAGGVRIDHAMGLQRLWVIPDGATANEGAYLRYPRAEMLRLLALESMRHRAIVVGEDLGTVPEGFRAAIAGAGVMGMRVLWFEQDTAGGFLPAAQWDPQALALTTTHDLPTVAGWWGGRDIHWRARISGDPSRESAESAMRAQERPRLWSAFCDAGVAQGPPPPADHPDAVIDAAVAFIGHTPCHLAIAPMEDILGLTEQPNLPGTTDQHPNWRRRLPPHSSLGAPDAARRLALLDQSRHSP